MKRPKYRIIDCPDPLIDDDGLHCMALPDTAQGVVWIDPEVKPSDRPRVLRAVADYLSERRKTRAKQ